VVSSPSRGWRDPDPLLALGAVPIYEYRCPKGHVFERFQRMSDPAPEGCEICGEGPVEVVLYPVAVHFKGPGFYTTDYGRGSKKREAPSEGGGDKVEKKTESKPEKKTEPASS
jgi:putative FmdB family regulatory protein